MNREQVAHGMSPRRPLKDDPNVHDIESKSKESYGVVKEALRELISWFSKTYGGQPLCVTYFDEAQALETRLWILLRLFSHQDMEQKMWYVFMGTKSNKYFLFRSSFGRL